VNPDMNAVSRFNRSTVASPEPTGMPSGKAICLAGPLRRSSKSTGDRVDVTSLSKGHAFSQHPPDVMQRYSASTTGPQAGVVAVSFILRCNDLLGGR
jgi:hypothetical protein